MTNTLPVTPTAGVIVWVGSAIVPLTAPLFCRNTLIPMTGAASGPAGFGVARVGAGKMAPAGHDVLPGLTMQKLV